MARAMGKYMRKCREEEAVGAMEVTQAVGVRTRSRAAMANVVVSKRRKAARSRAAAANVVVSKRRKALPPDSPAGDALAASASSLGGESGSYYLKLRSRMLFMAPPPPAAGAGGEAEELAAGLTLCSSTASSVDEAAAQDTNLPCGSDAAKAGGGCGHVLEGSASNNSESGLDHERERRETTPSNHLPGDFSDLESDLAGQNRSWSLSQVQATARVRIPPAIEIEEFFMAAEEVKAKHFASKYNFDVARGMPLDAGRFEWTAAVSSS